jgi:hypothetical protein
VAFAEMADENQPIWRQGLPRLTQSNHNKNANHPQMAQ